MENISIVKKILQYTGFYKNASIVNTLFRAQFPYHLGAIIRNNKIIIKTANNRLWVACRGIKGIGSKPWGTNSNSGGIPRYSDNLIEYLFQRSSWADIHAEIEFNKLSKEKYWLCDNYLSI